MSDANRVRLSYIKETTYGTTPTGGLKVLRITGESLQQAIDTTVSQEIRADRQTADFIRTGLRVNGDINFELSHGSQRDLTQYAMFSPDITANVDITFGANVTVASVGGGVYTITRASAGFISTDLLSNNYIGRWIKFSGFVASSGANNTYAKFVSVTSTVLTVSHAVMVAEGPVGSITCKILPDFTAATTLNSVSIEREYQDLSTTFAKFTGMIPATMNWQGNANSVMTGSFGFLGKAETSVSSTIGTSYANAYATVTPVWNGIDNMTAFLEGGTAASIFSFNMTLNNNLRERLQMGTLGPISIASGQIAISGQVVYYFTSSTLADKFLNFTGSSLVWRFVDSSGNATILDLPQVKYSTGPRPAPGINQDVFLTMGFQAYLNSATSQSMRMAFYDAP